MSLNLRSCFLLFLLLLFSSYVNGQTHVLSNQTQFELLTMKDGLPSNSGNAFIQDREGYIWIGTFNGLSKYDGYTFKHYQKDKENPDSSLVGNYIRALYQDREGYIWIGTMLSGLQRFDPIKETFISYPFQEALPIDNYITKITGDTWGNIWVGTTNGLIRLSSPNGTFQSTDVVAEHFSSKGYPPSLVQFFADNLKTSQVVERISKVGKNQQLEKAFVLLEASTITIIGLGEYGGHLGGMLDFGWITNVQGDTVWQMKYENTYTAPSIYKRSDHPCNRLAIQKVKVDAGTYTLHYRSNEQHHHDNWDLTYIPEPYNMKKAMIPAFDSLWGIHLFSLEKEQTQWLDQELKKVKRSKTISGSTVLDLYVDSIQQLWVATSAGLDRIKVGKSIEIEHLHLNSGDKKTSNIDFVSAIYPRKKGGLWVYGHELKQAVNQYHSTVEIYSLDEQPKITSIIRSPKLQRYGDILEDKSGKVWLTSHHQGLFQLGTAKDAVDEYNFTFYPSTSNYAGSIFEDSSNVVWVGFWKEGVYKLNPSITQFNFISLPFGEKTAITTFTQDKSGLIYMGTNNKGCLIWDSQKQTLTPIPLPKHSKALRPIIDICVDQQDRLWIATDKEGVYLYNLNTKKYTLSFPSSQHQDFANVADLRALHCDSKGAVWISSTVGIHQYQPASDQFIFYPNLSNQLIEGAHDIKETSENDLWIMGQLSGLYNIDLNTTVANSEVPIAAAHFPKEIIHSIEDAGNQHIWVGMVKGLHLEDRKTKEKIDFKNQSLLPKTIINNIHKDAIGNIWLVTPAGIGKYELSTGAFSLFGPESGIYLHDSNTPSILSKKGTILIGGKNGFYTFSPAEVKPNSIPPLVDISRLIIQPTNNSQQQALVRDISYQQNFVQLQPNQHTFEIDYVGLHFDKAQDKKYAYRMIGLNDRWIEVDKERIARFNGLQPGAYTFQVKASNGDGQWATTATSLQIDLLPPWWQTKWAYVSYLLVFSAILFAIYNSQVQRIKLNNKLAFEQKEAERLGELDRLKTNFFSNITHEFRTPLTLIIEPIRQLRKQWMGKKEEQTLQIVENNSQQLLKLVNQLLDLSKLESGFMSLDLRKGNLLAIVEPIFLSFQTAANKKGLYLKLECPENLPEFYFDLPKLEKVLYNLLSNAIKFTQKGSVHLTIQLVNKETNLHIKVQDTGSGIDTKQLPYIFDRFYQADSTNTRKQPGTGIGLALTKELVEIMNASIEVESQLGKGSSFLIKLPVIKELSVASEKSIPAIKSNSIKDRVPVAPLSLAVRKKIRTVRDKELILLVEDNPELRQFLVQSLQDSYSIIEASNGLEGIEKAKEKIPDLIVSDVMMPEKDGFEVCNILKKEELTAHIPIILLTAKSAIESKIKGLKTGADAYLTKPFHTEELIVRIENLIELRKNLQKKYSSIALTEISSTAQEEPPIPGESSKQLSALDQSFLQRITTLIETNIDNEALTIEELANLLFLSRSQLHRKLKALTALTPSEFLRNYRLDKGMELVKENKEKISQIAYQVGFSDEKYFSRRFKEKFKATPSEVRKKAMSS